jgi:hypothetical protein
MKYFLIIAMLVLSIACTKSVNDPSANDVQVSRSVNTEFTSNDLTRNINGVILKVILEPNVTCYSYRNGETPKPCDIFVNIRCTLSAPINKHVKVEILKTNEVAQNKGSEANAISNVSKVVITFAPNTTSLTLNSTISNKNNNHIPEDQFKIGNVTTYTLVN